MKKFYREKIITNKAMCIVCDDIIESKHRHDFVTCTCGALSVDGGKEYLKRCANERSAYIDLSEVEQVEREPYSWELEIEKA